MKTVFLMIATALLANTVQAADTACGANERQVTTCHISANIDNAQTPRVAAQNFSLCSDGKKLFVNFDTEIHPSIPGTRFELSANAYDPRYLWQDVNTMKVVKIEYPTYQSKGFPVLMRVTAFDFRNNTPERLTGDSVYQCAK